MRNAFSKLPVPLLLGISVLLGCLVLVVTFFDPTPVASPSSTAKRTTAPMISIMNDGFMPQTILVNKDAAVTWKNTTAQPRRLMAVDNQGKPIKGFGEVTINPGETYTYSFDNTGMVRYNDSLNPLKEGEIQVK